jgi:hypothetical protein
MAQTGADMDCRPNRNTGLAVKNPSAAQLHRCLEDGLNVTGFGRVATC